MVGPDVSANGEDAPFGRISRNLIHVLEYMPGVALSPVPLFALFLPIFATRRTPVPGDEAPLVLMLLFPLAYDPLTRVEPRQLFPVIIALNVFGAAGLWAFSAYATRFRGISGTSFGGSGRGGEHSDQPEVSVELPGLIPARAAAFFFVLSGILLLGNLMLSAWRGIEIERGYRFHRPLAQWISRQVDPGEAIVGCGLGYVSTTGYLAARRTVPRPPALQPEDLARFVRDRGLNWLVLYEPCLSLESPGLLSMLDVAPPDYRRVFEVRDDQGRRIQVFRVEDHRGQGTP